MDKCSADYGAAVTFDPIFTTVSNGVMLQIYLMLGPVGLRFSVALSIHQARFSLFVEAHQVEWVLRRNASLLLLSFFYESYLQYTHL